MCDPFKNLAWILKYNQSQFWKVDFLYPKCLSVLTPTYLSQDQEEMIKRHQEELRMLHQKLDLHTDTSLDRFRQTAMVSMSFTVNCFFCSP